jgi:hypothetical protein
VCVIGARTDLLELILELSERGGTCHPQSQLGWPEQTGVSPNPNEMGVESQSPTQRAQARTDLLALLALEELLGLGGVLLGLVEAEGGRAALAVSLLPTPELGQARARGRRRCDGQGA